MATSCLQDFKENPTISKIYFPILTFGLPQGLQILGSINNISLNY